MSFHPLTIASETFNEVGPGRYMLSTVTFGNPKDYIQIKGGTFNKKSGLTTASVSRITQKDVTVGSEVFRRQASVQLVIQVSDGFTTAEVDAMVESISTFISEQTGEQMLQGQQ